MVVEMNTARDEATNRYRKMNWRGARMLRPRKRESHTAKRINSRIENLISAMERETARRAWEPFLALIACSKTSMNRGCGWDGRTEDRGR
jgi:hypothetical protein